jgi:hypothetical protein
MALYKDNGDMDVRVAVSPQARPYLQLLSY